jgi:DNA-binding NtrC family response regulator
MLQKILLFGLDGALASELAGVLAGQSHELDTAPLRRSADGMRSAIPEDAGLVFCPARHCRSLLGFVRRERPTLPVVAVSQETEVSHWLDAMEAGAADYCSPPFEPSQLRWIVENTVKYRLRAAA